MFLAPMNWKRPSFISILTLSLLLQTFFPRLVQSSSVVAGDSTANNSSPERLSRCIVPTAYVLNIIPDLSGGSFQGFEQILISVSAPTRNIVLNSLDLKITESTLTAATGANQSVQNISPLFDTVRQTATFSTPDNLAVGDYTLSLRFSGEFNKQLRGFYITTARDDSGKVVPLAATQFEPTDARRMFPCFDEPSFKAKFRLSTVIDPKLRAISNAPITRIAVNQGKMTVTFHETPKISTYLLALFIGPFKSTPPLESAGVPIRVWTIGQKLELGTKAQYFAARFLPFYNEYFNVQYPETKLDLVAIPDFEAGAMENLGAIAFRETALLYDQKTDSIGSQIGIASIIAHEMAHMWFGDLVTMNWWDDLWLNEAFASWMAHKAIDKIEPSWHTWESWARAKNESMTTDSLLSSRSIHATVLNPVQALEMFDDITYSKGASIIRMLERYVGDDVFKRGVQLYIKRYQFQNATTTDLWNAIGEVSARSIAQIMEPWVNEPGFPILQIADKGGRPHVLSQSRFFTNQVAASKVKEVPPWQIPVGFYSALSATGPRSLPNYLLLKTRFLSLETDRFVEPYFCNAEAAGYYRVSYPPSDLSKLIQLKQTSLSPTERYTLLSDQCALFFNGSLSSDHFLPFLQSFKAETDPLIILAVCEELDQLFDLIDESSEPLFAKYINDILAPIKDRLTWHECTGESEPTKFARNAVLRTLANYGRNQTTVAEARQYFSKYIVDWSSISPDIVSAAESIVAFNGDQDDYRNLKTVWLKGPTPSAQKRALMALSLLRKPELVDQTLSLTIDQQLKLQDAPGLLSATLRQKQTNPRAWAFVKENWDKLKTLYPPYMMGEVVSGEGVIKDKDEESDFSNFFKNHSLPEAERDIIRTDERIRNNVSFVTGAQASIHKWLFNHFGSQAYLKSNARKQQCLRDSYNDGNKAALSKDCEPDHLVVAYTRFYNCAKHCGHRTSA
jgi:puromycin-sensitive aminopeptidase